MTEKYISCKQSKGGRGGYLTLDKVDCRAKTKLPEIERNKYVNSSILKENTAILNVYAPNNRTAKYVTQKLKWEIDKHQKEK